MPKCERCGEELLVKCLRCGKELIDFNHDCDGHWHPGTICSDCAHLQRKLARDWSVGKGQLIVAAIIPMLGTILGLLAYSAFGLVGVAVVVAIGVFALRTSARLFP
jgi:hypothetical protein